MNAADYSDKPDQFYERLERVLQLPLRQQAMCVLLAADMSLPVWKAVEKQYGCEGAAEQFIQCFKRWSAGEASDGDLDSASKPLEAVFGADLTKLQNPLPSMAGIALVDVKLVALDQCDDVHDDILTTAVCYAAAAACGGHPSPTWATWNNLTERQFDLLDIWWDQCSVTVAEL